MSTTKEPKVPHLGGGGDEPLHLSKEDDSFHVLRLHDVMMGRGKGAHIHAGNVHFRKVILEHVPAYLANEKNKPARKAIANRIVDQIESEGRRFLSRVENYEKKDDRWSTTPKHIVVAKVKQAIRDMGACMTRSSDQKKESPSKSDAAASAFGNTPIVTSPRSLRRTQQQNNSTEPARVEQSNLFHSQSLIPGAHTEAIGGTPQVLPAQHAEQAQQPSLQRIVHFNQQQLLRTQLLQLLAEQRSNNAQQQYSEYMAEQRILHLSAAVEKQQLLQQLLLHQQAPPMLPFLPMQVAMFNAMQNRNAMLASSWNRNPGSLFAPHGGLATQQPTGLVLQHLLARAAVVAASHPPAHAALQQPGNTATYWERNSQGNNNNESDTTDDDDSKQGSV